MASHRVTSLDELPPARAVLCDLSPRPFLAHCGSALSSGVPAQPRALSVRHGRLQGRLGTRRADSVARGRVCACTHGPRVRRHSRNSRGRNRTRGRASRRSVRSFCSCSRRSSIRRGRRPESTRRGPTATCRAARRSTCCRASKRRSSASRPGFRDRVLARAVMTPADIEAHNANLRRRRHRIGRRRPAPVLHAADVAHLLDAAPRSLHLFGGDAARRRRARHVRILRGAARARGRT